MNEEIATNALVCVLEKCYPLLYKSLFTNAPSSRLVLVPTSTSLVNAEINQRFIETHILQASDIPGHYLNLVGQGVEIQGDLVSTSFGFKNQCVCHILAHDKIYHNDNSINVALIDSHLLFCANDEFNAIIDSQATPDVCIQRWADDDVEFAELFYGGLKRFKGTFVMVPGYETETAKAILTSVKIAINKYLQHKNDAWQGIKHNMAQIALVYAFQHLHSVIWKHLQATYAPQEEILQARVTQLKKKLNLNRSLDIFDKRHQLTKMNLLPSAQALRMMETAESPLDKFEHLNRAILLNTKDSKEEATTSLMILTIVTGGLQNAVAHVAHLDMYAQCAFASKSATHNLHILENAIAYLLE